MSDNLSDNNNYTEALMAQLSREPGVRMLNFVQRAEGGGFPVPNGEGFHHGDDVMVVATNDLRHMADLLVAMCVQAEKGPATVEMHAVAQRASKLLASIGNKIPNFTNPFVTAPASSRI